MIARIVSRSPSIWQSLSLFINHGANLDTTTKAGETVLQEVVRLGDIKAAKILLETCTNVNTATNSGETALHWACANDDADMVDLLLQHGAKVDSRTKAGKTPLDWTSDNKTSKVKSLLARKGIEVVMQTPDIKSEELNAADKEHFPNVTIWAVLVGINDYSRVGDPNSGTQDRQSHFSNLRGCVNDILLVEKYLHDDMGTEPKCIKKLVTESPYYESNAPTYRNIIEALESTTATAAPGDSVYIHYSGHGGQAPTVFPLLKGRGHSDGLLIPSDVNDGGQCLRDLELEYFLRKMVDKGLAVTVVLDSSHYQCNSKSIHRSELSTNYVPDGIPVLLDDINQFFDPQAPHNQGKSLFLQPKGYTIFTNSQSLESDVEGSSYGLLTYSLLNVLRKGFMAGCTCRTISRRLASEVDQFKPILIGEADRPFHGAGNSKIMASAGS